MNDPIPPDQPLPRKAEHMPRSDARGALMTGRVRYILAISVTLVVIAFAIIYFIYA